MDTVAIRNKFLPRVYGWMALSLVISFLSAFIFSQTSLAYAFAGGGMQSTIIWIILLIAELYMIHKVSKVALDNPTLGLVGLIFFSAFDGATMCGIFVAYAPQLIINAFLISATDFICMSVLGVIVKKNMSTLRRQLYAMVMALLVVWVVELFLQSTMVFMILSGIGVIVFSALTMADTNSLVRLANNSDEMDLRGLAVVGALNLYLDFINLFVDILNLLGISNR